MKYTKKSRNPLKSIDKQVEEKAYKHALRKYNNVTPEMFRNHKQHYINVYFQDFPAMKNRVNEVKRNRRNFAALLTVGMIAAVGTISISAYKSAREESVVVTEVTSGIERINTPEREEERKFVEETIKQEKRQNVEVNSIKRDADYKKMLEQMKDLKDDELINYNTKQIIADAYNKVNSSNPITAENLGIKVYSPDYLVVKKDKLGNIVETRMKTAIDENSGEEMAEKKNVYKYYIDGKLVAVYTEEGKRVTDSTIEKEDKFFENTVEMVRQSERLKNVYIYLSSENDKKNYQEKYVEVAFKLKDKVEKLAETENINLIENNGEQSK